MRFVVQVDRDCCKGCALCVEWCKKAVLRMSRALNAKGYAYPVAENTERCSGCRACTDVCPEVGIEVTANGREAASPAPPPVCGQAPSVQGESGVRSCPVEC